MRTRGSGAILLVFAWALANPTLAACCVTLEAPAHHHHEDTPAESTVPHCPCPMACCSVPTLPSNRVLGADVGRAGAEVALPTNSAAPPARSTREWKPPSTAPPSSVV